MSEEAKNKAIEKLSKYGTVRTCKIVNDCVVTIVLTDGFSEETMSTLNFIKEAKSLFSDFPIMETLITEENLAILVLKIKSI